MLVAHYNKNCEKDRTELDILHLSYVNSQDSHMPIFFCDKSVSYANF